METMDKHARDIVEQAAAYYVQRPGETTAQRHAREAWLARDERHARAYAEMEQLWNRLDGLRDNPELQALKAADLAALRRPRRPGRARWLVAAALALLVSSLYLAHRALTPAWTSYATPMGARQTEVLVDGTRVTLNTDSALRVRYTRTQRDIMLDRGEAQFDVAHDTARPFVVHVGEDSVTALGTRFQVRREADAVAVTLLQGTVEVAQGQDHRRLQPNEQARLAADGIHVHTIDPRQAEAWLDGWLRFRDTPLGEVVAEANRYATRKLQLADPALASLKASGSFRTGDTAALASGIALILPVRVDDRGTVIVLAPK